MISWIRFEWKTDALPKDEVSSDPFVIRAAQKSEEDDIAKVIKSAFSLDSIWGDVNKPLSEKIALALEAAFSLPEPSCVALVHGTRIIGASVLDLNPGASNHLSSGPCILHEYRNRGLASKVLAASLAFLQEKEIPVARGVTRANSITARFIYSKFGSVQHPIEGDPLQLKAA